MPATDQQVQNFVDQYVRPFCEAARALKVQADDIKGLIDDVYAALTEQNPTWTDSRTDGPPHLLSPSDVLAINTFISNLQTFVADGANQYTIVDKGCVRPLI